MDTIAKSDAFFFITSIAIIVIAIAVIIVLFYVIRLARHIAYVAKKIREESDHVAADLALMRAKVRAQGTSFTGIIRLFSGFFKKTKKRRSTSENGAGTSAGNGSKNSSRYTKDDGDNDLESTDE